MKGDGEKLVSEVQLYLSKGAILHSHIRFNYLSELYNLTQRKKACMLPLPLLEYYNLRINRKIQAVIDRKQRKVA